MRVLVAIDDSPFSDVAIRAVAARPWPEGTEIRLMHAVEVPPMVSFTGAAWPDPPVDLSSIREAERARGTQLLERAAEQFIRTSLKVSTRLIEGSARTTILDEARTWPADLVVLGSHGSKGLTRFLLGSVSETIVRHAPCSVEIIKAPTGNVATPQGGETNARS